MRAGKRWPILDLPVRNTHAYGRLVFFSHLTVLASNMLHSWLFLKVQMLFVRRPGQPIVPFQSFSAPLSDDSIQPTDNQPQIAYSWLVGRSSFLLDHAPFFCKLSPYSRQILSYPRPYSDGICLSPVLHLIPSGWHWPCRFKRM